MNQNKKANQTPTEIRYTCVNYREEMILLGLRKQLDDKTLTEQQRLELESEISRLEKIVGL